MEAAKEWKPRAVKICSLGEHTGPAPVLDVSDGRFCEGHTQHVLFIPHTVWRIFQNKKRACATFCDQDIQVLKTARRLHGETYTTQKTWLSGSLYFLSLISIMLSCLRHSETREAETEAVVRQIKGGEDKDPGRKLHWFIWQLLTWGDVYKSGLYIYINITAGPHKVKFQGELLL